MDLEQWKRIKNTDCKESEGLHYEVWGPPRTRYYGSYEPPEYGCDWVMVVAKNASDARKVAVKTREMRDYAVEMRGDNKPPWYKIKVKVATCEHGSCWGCEQECFGCEMEASLVEF
jgi:hypothetical protein